MRAALLGLLLLGGCTTATLNCPSDHVVTATMNGPDYVTIITTLAGLAAGSGMLMARSAGVSGNDGTLTVKTLDIGQQSYSCGNISPPAVAVRRAPVVAPPALQPQAAPIREELPPTRIL